MRDSTPKFRLGFALVVLAGAALMWLWPTRAPQEPGAPSFPPTVPALPDDGGVPAPDAGFGRWD